jgi:hypothetical protein
MHGVAPSEHQLLVIGTRIALSQPEKAIKSIDGRLHQELQLFVR